MRDSIIPYRTDILFVFCICYMKPNNPEGLPDLGRRGLDICDSVIP